MISSNEFRPGLTIEYRGRVWQIVESMHVKPGKGSAFVQTKLKSVESGDVLKVNFRAGEKVTRANVERYEMQFVYRDRDTCVLMNHDGTESLEVPQQRFGADIDLLQENLEGIEVLKYGDAILRVQLPNVVELKVAETAPDERGDTNSGGGKQAVLNTGATITVPFHIGVGDKIRVDTRSRQYLGRVPD